MNCQDSVIQVVAVVPAAIVASAMSITRRTPKRSISAAENGAVSPYISRPSEIPSEIVARDQWYSCCSGMMSTPGAARNPAVVISVTKVTTTISHA